MAQVVVTGAGGFLGTAVTRAFLQAGHCVRAADLARVDLSLHRSLGAEAVACDLTRVEEARRAFAGRDIVVHTAGLFDFTASDDLLWKVNADCVATVCNAAAREGVQRLVHISSTGVYGRAGLGVRETDPKDPVMAYERSKWDGEQLAWSRCEALGLPLTVLRPTMIYGAGSRYGLAPAIALFALRQRKGLRTLPIASGGPTGHLVHVEDVAAAVRLVCASDAAVGRVFNVADDKPIRAGDLIRALAATSQVAVSSLALPWWTTVVYPAFRPLVKWRMVSMNERMARAWSRIVNEEQLVDALLPRLDLDFFDYVLANHSYDTTALRSIGFSCTHSDPYVGITKTAEWYRAHRWLPPLECAG